MNRLSPMALAVALAIHLPGAHAQSAAGSGGETVLPTVNVNASADASAQGLSPAYPGGQVARGGRAGILGTRDNMETPFSITSYTNDLIQDKQARSVGEVLQNDPGVRVARGFGNFQESYFVRGFILNSDDVAYNGLFSLLPRQYIATELFERVEVLRGASAFLTGANPGGGGIGGSINLLPKRATNEPLTRLTAGTGSGGQYTVSTDIARRFGPDQSTGIRFNAAKRGGGTAINDEDASLDLVSVGLDWRSRDVRLSADIGWQDNKLKQTRPNVTLDPAVTVVPGAPDPKSNFAQPWTFSNERDFFGTFRGEYDLNDKVTAWAAYGMRRSEESNSLANMTVTNGATGAGNFTRFDNAREDTVDTGEIGLRGKLRTGAVGHEWVAAASYFNNERDNAYAWDFFNPFATNLYTPTSYAQPPFSGTGFSGNNLAAPALNVRVKMSSFAIGDTLSFINDTLLVTLGARQQTLKTENFSYGTGTPAPVYDESRVSPAVGVVYKLGKQLSVYGNYIEGLTQGDTAPGFAVNSGEMLKPYVSKQQEVGVKYDGGRLGASAAVFSTTKPRGVVNAANIFTSEGEDRHQGLELTLFGEAVRGLRLLGGATWLDTEQKNTGVAGSNGKRVIGVPEFQANLGADWNIPGVPRLAVDGRVVYTGSNYVNEANTLEVPDWTRFDLGVRYLVAVSGKAVTLRARIDNVTNKSHWASVGGYPGQGYLVAGGPRSLWLSASVDF